MSNGANTAAEPAFRWTILCISTVILAVTMGQLVNGLSVYFVPLETEFGWSRGDIALVNTFGLIGLALGSIVMGFATERYGIRPVATMGIAATGLTTILASQSGHLWQLYVAYFLAGFFGGGALSAPLMALVGNWFQRGAGLAIGIASAGQAFGQGSIPFFGAILIDAFGWRGAMLAQGLIVGVILLPLGFFLTDRKIEGTSEILNNETPSGLPNWVITTWLSIAVVLCCICMSVPLMHLVPLIQGHGFSAPEASGVLFSMLLIAIAGRIAFGRFADIVGAIPAYLTTSAWQTILVFGFVYLGSLGTFYPYALIYGFGYAGVMTTLIFTARTLAAPARRASTIGVVLAFAYFGHGIGGWQGGFFYDLTENYDWSFGNAAIAGLLNLLVVAGLWFTINRDRPATADGTI